jgi:hypothetical protein
MRLVCPACGAIASLDVWQNGEAAKECVLAICRLPMGVAQKTPEYLSLFRPNHRALQWGKALRLVNDLQAHITGGWVQWGKSVARNTTPDMWASAMSRILDTPPRDLPLKNHNYLIRIVYDIADQADRESEVKRNKLERTGGLRKDSGSGLSGIQEEFEYMSPKEMRRIREEKLGKRHQAPNRKDITNGD